MTFRVLAPVLCLMLAVAAWAEAPRRHTPPQASPVPISWIPEWLMEPIERAIADAHDPKERKKSR